MRKKTFGFGLVLLTLVSLGNFYPVVAQAQTEDPPIESTVLLTGIEITALPAKLEYAVGEELNLDGIVVTASYSDTSIAEV